MRYGVRSPCFLIPPLLQLGQAELALWLAS